MVASKGQNKKYDYFSANAQAAQAEEQLAQAQQQIAELESLNAQLQALVAPGADSDTAKFTLPLDLLVRNPEQVRRYFDPNKLATLTASIREVGVKSPLWVRRLPDGKYLLIAGERRYRAAKTAGLTEVPVTIMDVDDTSALKLSLLENLQREDLNPVEETEGILHLLSWQLDCTTEQVISILNRKAHLDKKKVEPDDSTENVFRMQWEIVENVFAFVGKLSPESFRVSRLPLLKMPADVLSSLRSGQLEYTKARALARVKEEELRKALLEKAVTLGLSLNQIKELIKTSSPVPEEQPSLKTRMKEAYRRSIEAKFWDDPNKQKQLKKLVEQLEALLASE